MDLGWYIPNCHYGGYSLVQYTQGKPFPPGVAIDPESFVAIAKEAEEIGFAIAWLGDHIMLPKEEMDRGGGLLRSDWPVYDCFSVLSYLAAITTRMRLGVGVIVIPYRNPVMLAKTLVSIDTLSGGRVTAGVGLGWLKPEFKTLGVPYEARGARTDEYLAVMRTLWTQDSPRYDGEFYQLDGGSSFLPKPLNGTIPIWVGGQTQAALNRAARLGDGFLGPYATPEETADWRRRLHEAITTAGRDPDDVPYGAMTRFYITDEPYPDAPTGIGPPAKVADDILRFKEAGIDNLKLMPPPGPTRETVLTQLRRFADEVKPRLDF